MKKLNYILIFTIIFLFMCKYNNRDMNMKIQKIKHKTELLLLNPINENTVNFLNINYTDLVNNSDNNNSIFSFGNKHYKWKYKFRWFPCSIARLQFNNSHFYIEPSYNGNYIFNNKIGAYLYRVEFI